MEKDRVPAKVIDMTALGLVEITRKKVRKPLYELLEREKEELMSHWKTWVQKKDKKQMAATAKDLGIIAAVISVVVLLAYAANGIFPFGEHSIARGDMVQQTEFPMECTICGMCCMEKQVRFLRGIPAWEWIFPGQHH